MIITQISGGLGNQLFQYAAGRGLASMHNTTLKCDLSHYHQPQSRSLDLSFFHAHVTEATQAEIANASPENVLEKIVERIKPCHLRKVYKEPHFHFDKNFFKARPDAYLKGDWQSECYFQNIASVVRADFKIKEEHLCNVAGFAAKLRKANTVALHVRRGDYLLPKFAAYHGVLSKEYYRAAVNKIVQKVHKPTFYIFSDDPNWVKTELHFDHPMVFVSGEVTKTAIEDFYLMQCCPHNIIANSSFSWWAAWLNENPNKMVIGPKQWFNQGPKDTQDLFPSEWVVI